MSGGPPPTRPSGFQWDFGGWFGSQLGSTLWMLLAGSILLARVPLAASVVIGIFLLVNALEFSLWQARARLSAHRGVQAQLWISGLGSIACLFALGRLGGFEALPGGGPASDVKWSLAVLAFTVLLSLVFWRRQRRATS